MAIAGRLWWVDRQLASLTDTGQSKHVLDIYRRRVGRHIISAVSNTVMLALYALNNTASLAGLDVVSQLAVCQPDISSPDRTESLRFGRI